MTIPQKNELERLYWGKHKRSDYPSEIIQKVETAYAQVQEYDISPTEEQVAEVAEVPGFIAGGILGMNTCSICGYTRVLEYGNQSNDPQDSMEWCEACKQNRDAAMPKEVDE